MNQESYTDKSAITFGCEKLPITTTVEKDFVSQELNHKGDALFSDQSKYRELIGCTAENRILTYLYHNRYHVMKLGNADVALSSTEAEYQALCANSQEIIYYHQPLENIGFNLILQRYSRITSLPLTCLYQVINQESSEN